MPYVKQADVDLETLLRQTTGDNILNLIISIHPHPVSRGVLLIDYYGDVM
jgi:low-affinity ferrous iron transport protein